MVRRNIAAAAGVAVLALAAAACQSSKSSNPLSPSVAGPIPGVQIGTPKLLEPTAGSKIAVDRQPITLLIENAGTTGVRPLSYTVDIATDANFNNKVFSRDSIVPGDGGRTSVKLPDALATGRTYFWRSQALDGANTGAYATASSFEIFTPIVINLPEPAQPGPNATVDSLRPKLVVNNATRSGPVGAISYLVELADNAAFANKMSWTTAEQPNQTSLTPPSDLAYNTVYYWHVRAFDPTTAGPWSPTLAFATLAAPVVVAPPSSSPTPSGPVPGDALDLSSAPVYNSPPDVNSWAVTSKITSISMSPSSGLTLEFTVGRAARVHGLGRRERERPLVHLGIHPDVARAGEHRRADHRGVRAQLGVRRSVGTDGGPSAAAGRTDGLLRHRRQRARRRHRHVAARAIERRRHLAARGRQRLFPVLATAIGAARMRPASRRPDISPRIPIFS
jgi:hypothetical protein